MPTFHIYVRDIETRGVVEKIRIQEKNLTPGRVDTIAAGLLRQIDGERFYVDDDEAGREALRRATKEGQSL